MDLTNEPLTKRKRAESPTLQPLSHPKRADGLWFDDGSIVLQAGTTQFRVHRSVLSANSAVFRDMFSVPQAAKGDEVVEGCYVVRLSDSAEDWIYVLRAFYDFRYDIRSPAVLEVHILLQELLCRQ
jgi:BTB/POZ domain